MGHTIFYGSNCICIRFVFPFFRRLVYLSLHGMFVFNGFYGLGGRIQHV